jgi:hypothetical protein
MCHDIHAEVHKDWFRYSKVDGGKTQTHKEHGDRIRILLFFFFKIGKVG